MTQPNNQQGQDEVIEFETDEILPEYTPEKLDTDIQAERASRIQIIGEFPELATHFTPEQLPDGNGDELRKILGQVQSNFLLGKFTGLADLETEAAASSAAFLAGQGVPSLYEDMMDVVTGKSHLWDEQA